VRGTEQSLDEMAAVSDKATRIIEAALTYPAPAADRLARERRRDSVLVIGGGVTGTQAACELAQMGHHVDLVETRPFLGGRAARIGTVFPTNDCGQCLPTTDAQAGVRKCFHRNLAIDDPKLHIWRRASVESVSGGAGDFEVVVRRLPNIVTDACINCGACETVCPEMSADGTNKAIYTEFYDGRVVRTVDLETCSFCGACVKACPVEALDFDQSPERMTLRAGAVLTAIGCEPAPADLLTHLGHGHEPVVTQTELAELLDDWEAQSAAGHMPARELVMIQCAGSRDRRRLPYCSRLCCMIALKHAIRLRMLFPEMKVTICYLELRAAGIGYENWYLEARRAGVEFLRGTPPEVQFDENLRPVIEVDDMSAGRKRTLRPDLVVLSSGMVPASDTRRIAEALQIERDEDGFIEILDRKNRATETTREGVFVAGSAAGPKALVECNTEASAVASEIHNFLASAGRRSAPASVVDAATCVGCDICFNACPFNAISLVERPADAPRPAEVKDEGKLAVIDEEACHACGICAANCPELAIRHNLADEALFGRLRIITEGVEEPVVGFYCRECAGAAISLGGLRHDSYPPNVRLIELPCLGRVSALHVVEAARLGAKGVFLAGCAEGRCQYRTGDSSAVEQARLAAELLEDAGRRMPIELWHLCAVDGASVGRRIRRFCDQALNDGDPANDGTDERTERGVRELVTVIAGEAPCVGGETDACTRC
jgi:heterodisulfide reductase subunit A2